MAEFSAVVESWRDVFGLAGPASATMLGLLFVGVSFRADIRQQPDESLHRAVAGLNFLHYLVIILFSLYFLMPGISPDELAMSIILTALVALASVVRATICLRPQLTTDRETNSWNLLIPIGCYLATARAGFSNLINDDDAISWMVSVIAFLMIIPTRNTWEMLLSSRQPG